MAILLPATASGAVRRGDATDGTRFFLKGKNLDVRLPAGLRPGWRLRVACGSHDRAGRRIQSARATYRGVRRIGLRFRRDISQTAEWCVFESFAFNVELSTLPSSAVALRPLRRQPPVPLTPGPGVRQAVTTDTDGKAHGGYAGYDGDATFLLRGSVLTVRLRAPHDHAMVVRVACFFDSRLDKEVILGFRAVPVRARQRVITADLGRDVASRATSCLLEGAGNQNSGDIAAAEFPAP